MPSYEEYFGLPAPPSAGYYAQLFRGGAPSNNPAYTAQLFAAPGGGPARAPTYSGAAVLGDPDRFTAAVFAGTAADEDAFLGLPAGTTVYGPCAPPGGAIACAGYLTGTSTAAVAAAQAQLAGYAGAGGGELIVPTGLGWQGRDAWPSCWFAAGDLAWSPAGVVASTALGPGSWEVGYSLIFRRSG